MPEPEPFHFTVSKSVHCCAVYYLQGVTYLKPSDDCIDAVIAKSKIGAIPEGHIPLIIEFSSAAASEKGDEKGPAFAFYKYLLQKGYRCDKFRLGKNTKSKNHVTLYHWYLQSQDRDASIIRDITYGERNKKAADDQSGASAGARTTGKSRTGRGVFGRVVS